MLEILVNDHDTKMRWRSKAIRPVKMQRATKEMFARFRNSDFQFCTMYDGCMNTLQKGVKNGKTESRAESKAHGEKGRSQGQTGRAEGKA
ncbi:MAG TPA: hypothetical protein VKF82_09055 [Candidatus Eremiobacteraceae bacterium]|nr:hypothetical protein [Candidatus Eremiobacteraceae bacterium]